MTTPIRHDYRREEILALFELPFTELVFRAASVHREHFDPTRVQVSTLLSIKTGGCPEDCGYCPQAARHDTGVAAQKLMDADDVVARARQARDAGATRFCMGAAWRSPKDRDIPKVAAMIRAVRELGLETCATLGMLSADQALALKDAGLDYYNHNLDRAGVLRLGDRHPRLSGSSGHPGGGARGRAEDLLRRYRRHGRKP